MPTRTFLDHPASNHYDNEARKALKRAVEAQKVADKTSDPELKKKAAKKADAYRIEAIAALEEAIKASR